MQSVGGNHTADKDWKHELNEDRPLSKIRAEQMREMFQLLLDTLLPVSRC